MMVIIAGCSGQSSQPIMPDAVVSQPELTGNAVATEKDANASSHYLLAYNLIYVDPDAPDGPKFEVIPVREGEIHLNILTFLEKGPCLSCFKLVGFTFPVPGTLNVDIQIDHPFDDLTLSVFDVRAIMMFQGSHMFPTFGKGTSDPALGDGALLNADGYSALYNGSTITAPVGDLQKYYPGNMATPAIPNSDINGFKYFITDIPSNNRNAFFGDSSGVDVQTYSLKLPTGPFVLGYAVDASWWLPINTPVDDPLTDFDSDANCIEPWKVAVTEQPIGEGLTTLGGQTKLLIDVYDWQGKTTYHAPVVECPQLFDSTLPATWVSDTTDYSRYEVTVSNSKLAAAAEYMCLIGVEANENNPTGTPWLDLTAYQLVNLEVTESTNQLPIACGSADPEDQTVCEQIHFTDCGSYDPDGGDLTGHKWDWNNDGVFDEEGTDLDHTWNTPGTYFVQYRVIDDEGGIDVLDQAIEITVTNALPTAVATADKTEADIGETINFDGSGSHDNDCGNQSITLWEWDFDYDSVEGFTIDGTGATISHSYDTEGTYIVQLRVTDNEGGTAMLDQPLEITVTQGPPEDPIANAIADPNPQFVNQPVSFSASDSYDPDGGNITLYEWDWYNDGTWDQTGENVDHVYTSSGTYLVQLRVTDDESETDTLDTPLSVEITSLNPIAVAEADPNPQLVNQPVSFSGSGSNDPDGGTIQLFEWDWNNDGTYDATGENVDHTWTSLGDYFVQLRVTDDEAQTDTLDDLLEIFISPTESGNLIWAKRTGGTSYSDVCVGYGISTLSDNSTVVTGSFEGSVAFGPGEPNQTILTSAGDYDIFIAHYNPDGTLAWAKRAGGASVYIGDGGKGITTLSDNSTVVTGLFSESASFGPGEPNQTVLTSGGGYDIFIARYNTDGTLAWAKRAGGADYWGDSGYGITTLSDNSAVVTGSFGDAATFGPGEPNQTILTSAGDSDIFIARYNPDGTLAWAKRAGGSEEYDYCNGIATLSDNSTVVTGVFGGSATFGSGEPNQTVLTSAGGSDIFIARYNPDGTLAWAKRAGGASGYDSGNGITTLSDNSTVVTGELYGAATFGPGELNQAVLTSAGWDDIFIARYNPDGTLAWAKSAGGSDNDNGLGITTLSDNSTVVTGQFAGSATFGPGEPNQTVLASAGGYDIFIARYNPDGTLAWAKRAGGADGGYPFHENGKGITALSDNSTVVTGVFYESATFGPGEPNQIVLTSAGELVMFLARFNP
jgi:uncharacterized delta-60 repeat protein